MAKSSETTSATESGLLTITLCGEVDSEDIKGWQREALKAYGSALNGARLELIAAYNKGRWRFGDTPMAIRECSPLAEKLPYRITWNSIVKWLKASLAAEQENAQRAVRIRQSKYDDAQARLEKARNGVATAKGLWKESHDEHHKKLLTKAHQSREYAEKRLGKWERRLRESEDRLKVVREGDHLPICLGGKARLHQRKKVASKRELAVWRKEWHDARYGSLDFVGSSDETLGGGNAHVDYRWYTEEEKAEILGLLEKNTTLSPGRRRQLLRRAEAGTFELVITIPEKLRTAEDGLALYPENKIRLPISLRGKQADLLRHHICLHKDEGVREKNTKKKGAKRKGVKKETIKAYIKKNHIKSAISVKLRRTEKGYAFRLTLTTNHALPKVCTDIRKGAIGVDFNNGHSDAVETDHHGNPVRNASFVYGVKRSKEARGKPHAADNRRRASEQTLKLVQWAKETGKPLVIEDLDFRKKKTALKEKVQRGYNDMLSGLPYSQFRELLTGQCLRHGVELLVVCAAYTSKIGKVKYAKRHAMDTHQAAAMVIARRAKGFKEKLPAICHPKNSRDTHFEQVWRCMHDSADGNACGNPRGAPAHHRHYQPRGLVVPLKRQGGFFHKSIKGYFATEERYAQTGKPEITRLLSALLRVPARTVSSE